MNTFPVLSSDLIIALYRSDRPTHINRITDNHALLVSKLLMRVPLSLTQSSHNPVICSCEYILSSDTTDLSFICFYTIISHLMISSILKKKKKNKLVSLVWRQQPEEQEALTNIYNILFAGICFLV